MDLSAVGEESEGYNLLGLSGGFDEQLRELIRRGSLDFDTWTSIISKLEKTYPDNVEKICSVYDSFLSEFPLCHGYWRKFATHKAHLCTVDEVVETFERAVQCATYCVGVWVEYCSFSMVAYEDPSDVRRLFKRAMSFVGKDYLSHPLWDKYIEFEFSQKQWSLLALIYVQTLKFPTKKLHCYYDNFKIFAVILESEMERHENHSAEIESESVPDAAAFTTITDEISCVINNLLDPFTGSFSYKALQKYVCIGERLYQESCELEKKIHCFEKNIRRPYFHVMPLDDNQLENWHNYLDFVEMRGDFDWVVKLYERCLIPCADYPEFWMRYVEFMESKGGRELANFALDRATKVFCKNVPAMHLFNARFKEKIGDGCGARAAFLLPDNEFNSDFVEKVVKKANMEKRLGGFSAASTVYEKALAMAAERQKLHTVSILFIHFSRLKYMMTGRIDEARDIIIDGIRRAPHCKLLLEGLVCLLMMHGGFGQVNLVDPIIADALSPPSDASQGLDDKDREDISVLYLQFVDQCGTVHEIIKAWNRHIKLFPHLLRTASATKLPTSGTPLSDNLMGNGKHPFPKPYRPSGGYNSDQLTQIQMPDNHSINLNQVFTSQIQPEEKYNSPQEGSQQLFPKIPERCMEDEFRGNKSTHGSEEKYNSALEGSQQLSPKIAEQLVEDESTVNDSTNDLEHQSGDSACGKMEPTSYLVHQSREAANEPAGPAHGLVHQPGKDAYEPMEATHGLVENTSQPNHLLHQVANVDSFSDASQKSMDSIHVEQELDHEQLLNYQEKGNGDSSPMFREQQSPTCNRLENSPEAKGIPCIVSPGSTTDSAQIQNKPVEFSSGYATSGFHGDSKIQHHEQWRVSPQKQCPPAEINSQMVSRLGDSHNHLPGQNPQVQGSSTTCSWPPQNLQQQSFVSEHHSLPKEQTTQFSYRSGGQYGSTDYNQAYNQMMENYFQQQHMIAQHYGQQEQFMQQLQAQQPYQLQQQHQVYLQQLTQLYYQQLPQLQEQQAQLMQQQLMNAYHQQQQIYHQFMQLQEQNPMQHGEAHQQHLQMQHQQPITSPPLPAWNSSYYQQVMPPHNSSASESPIPPQQSRGITSPHPASAPGCAVSPFNHQLQPSHGFTPHVSVASRPSSSPYNLQQSP